MPPTSSLGESQTHPCLKKRRGKSKEKTWRGSSSASPPPCPVPSPSPSRQSLYFLRHCLQQLQHGWHKHPQPVWNWLNIKGSRHNTLSPPCILASRKLGQARMFAWLKSAFHQSRSSEGINPIYCFQTSRETQGMEVVVEVQVQVDSQYWMLKLSNPQDFLASWIQWM